MTHIPGIISVFLKASRDLLKNLKWEKGIVKQTCAVERALASMWEICGQRTEYRL